MRGYELAALLCTITIHNSKPIVKHLPCPLHRAEQKRGTIHGNANGNHRHEGGSRIERYSQTTAQQAGRIQDSPLLK